MLKFRTSEAFYVPGSDGGDIRGAMPLESKSGRKRTLFTLLLNPISADMPPFSTYMCDHGSVVSNCL